MDLVRRDLITGIKYQIMKFNRNLNIDFAKWSHAKMERDINQTDGRTLEEDMPKFGAGSEYGREARLEAKKRKYSSVKKSSESSPWLLKAGGKTFKGVREGGITDNSSYYLFTHGNDGVINAHKLEEWYNFQPVQCYKTLTVEEAEEEFGRRNNIMNHFNVMLQKRLKNEEIEEVDDDEKAKGKRGSKNSKSKELKISEMEEWDLSDDEESDAEDDLDEKKTKNKQKQKKLIKARPKKKSKGSDESATEESDDGDEEGRELDYISDSSDEVSDDEAKVTKEMQGVSEEKALKSLLTSDEDEEDDEKKEEKSPEDKINSDDEEDEKIPKKEETIPKQLAPNKKKKKNDDKKSNKNTDSESESSVDSSDIESESIIKRPFSLDTMKGNSDSNSFTNDSSYQSYEPAQKKARVDFPPIAICDTHGITEEAVCRYLSRKPITTTELATKFKNRTNLSSEQLVSIIALLLKKINPEKKIIKNKMYLSLKHT